VPIDILMMIKKEGKAVAGESRSVANTKDELTSDFAFGNYVEIEDFDFGISLSDRDSSSGPSGESQNRKEKYEGKFTKFIQGEGPPANGQSRIYPVTFDEVSITRQLDKSSPGLFQTCFQTKSLDRVTVVKRKSAGTGASVGHIPYFRVDFDNVLVTDMGWSVSDDVVKEKLKFVYRSATMKYRPQNNDGTPGVVISVGPLSLLKTSG
jgi:type VI protein secretion system component Hcp